MAKIFIVIIIIAILVALASGLIGMLKGGRAGSNKMFNSLITRVSLSLVLFLLVLFAGFMGWIEPNQVLLDSTSQK